MDGPLVPSAPDALLDVLRRELGAEYELEAELGRGGMAIVYKAVEKDLRRTVALKVLPRGLAGPTVAERFRREARMAAALDHANIIPVYRVGQAAGTFFLAMRFIEGRSLATIIRDNGPLPIPAVVRVVREVATALAFAHERGIVHRDIKSGNILVTTEGGVMVSDFGIARAMEDNSLTAAGAVLGTPHFMSPEQGTGRRVGPASDQYSLGVLAFQMLTGVVPFDDGKVLVILQHHVHTPPPDIGAVRKDVPADLLKVVNRLLAKSPEARYETTAELVARLEVLHDQGGAEQIRGLANGKLLPRVDVQELPHLLPPRASTS